MKKIFSEEELEYIDGAVKGRRAMEYTPKEKKEMVDGIERKLSNLLKEKEMNKQDEIKEKLKEITTSQGVDFMYAVGNEDALIDELYEYISELLTSKIQGVLDDINKTLGINLEYIDDEVKVVFRGYSKDKLSKKCCVCGVDWDTNTQLPNGEYICGLCKAFKESDRQEEWKEALKGILFFHRRDLALKEQLEYFISKLLSDEFDRGVVEGRLEAFPIARKLLLEREIETLDKIHDFVEDEMLMIEKRGTNIILDYIEEWKFNLLKEKENEEDKE